MSRWAIAVIASVVAACSGPPSEPARPAAPAAAGVAPAPAPAPPADASVAAPVAVDAAAPPPIDAGAEALSACTTLPARTAKSRNARRYTPGDFLGKTLAQIEAELGAPLCRSGDAYQWIQPRGCTDRRLYISVWFAARRATHVVIDEQYTGEHCVYDF